MVEIRRPHVADGDPAAVVARSSPDVRLAGGEAREQAAERLARSVPEAPVDRLVRLAARLLHAPSAQLSLLGETQLIAAGTGAAGDAVGTRGPLADSLCTVTAAADGPLVVVDAASDARVAGLPPVTSGTVGAYLGVPVRSRTGQVVGALCTFAPEPRSWDAADIAVLDELSAAAAAELELEALSLDYEADRMRWELAIAAGGVGSFDLDLRTGALRWDDRLLEIFGYDRITFGGDLESFSSRVHPDDLDRVTHALRGAVDRCGEYDAEYRVVLPDGETRWVQARGTALPGADGRATRLLGAAYDTTRDRDSDARLSRVLETMSAAFYSLDAQWRFSYVNAEAERLLGRTRDELLGGDLWKLFPDAVGSPFETHYREAARTGRSVVFEAYYPEPLRGWYELRVWPSPDGLSVYFLDISARRTAQRLAEAEREGADAARRAAEVALERAETTTRQLELLARVTDDLTSTLDVRAAIARLGPHLVPVLGDWGIITLVDEHGALHDVGSWHADEPMAPVLERYSRIRLQALHPADSPVARAAATGRPVLMSAGAAEAVAHLLDSPEARTLIRELAPHSTAVLPMRVRGRTTGLLTLCRGVGRPPLTGTELLTATQVAERAGMALDNARLYGEQRRIAEGLQRSLLTDPVQPDHLQVVVRYLPAAEAARVGGDWYDAFLQPDGATVLVIGDVMGHDISAAAAMSQVRSLLRGIGYATGAGPAHMLGTLDAAMTGLAVGTTATAVVARIEQDDDDRARGVTRVRWSNAGHPPPLLVDPDGSVTALAAPRNDLLLGVVPSWARQDHEVAVDRGSTLVFYTDGLVERRGAPVHEGPTRLQEAVTDLARAPLDELVDGVVDRMLVGAPEDDVAILAVRLHPEVRPRPPEAGPMVAPPTPPTP
jgi:PAS domain S-box-containing protein